MPVCVYQRAKRHKSFKGVASFGYCASKDGQILSYTLTPANTDDRQAVFELTQSLQDKLLK